MWRRANVGGTVTRMRPFGAVGRGQFVKSRFRSRREGAKQTRKSRDLDQSAQSSETCGESVLCRARLQGRRSACSRQVDQFHVPLRQRRSSLFQPLGRKSALHRIYPYRPPHSSMEWMLCKEERFTRLTVKWRKTGEREFLFYGGLACCCPRARRNRAIAVRAAMSTTRSELIRQLLMH